QSCDSCLSSSIGQTQIPVPTSPALLYYCIGALYLSDCPQQHYIPIYLVVMGAFGLALALLSDLLCAQDSEGRIPNLLSCVRTSWNTLTSLFLFCWFISGNVWIYSIYQPNYNQTIKLYCNRTLYLFAFWINTLLYILLGVLLVWGCCLCAWNLRGCHLSSNPRHKTRLECPCHRLHRRRGGPFS
uniref:Uncharacterized protein n=1 Tax=Esox lucius TaxID=8010 RepID=A0A6Q2Y159_ESOLU